jgi:hypothetical protein
VVMLDSFSGTGGVDLNSAPRLIFGDPPYSPSHDSAWPPKAHRDAQSREPFVGPSSALETLPAPSALTRGR